MENDKIFTRGTQHEIYIGIKDKDCYEELLTAEDFKNILADICKEKEIGFSLLTQLGGYTHNKGYTMETSFRIIVIGADEAEIFEFGERLKKLINTDTILITRSVVEYVFL